MNELVITRKFTATPEEVFDFLTQGEHLLKWWGPEGMSLPEHSLDFTRPGTWVSVMLSPEGNRFKVSGQVTAVDVPKSVEFTWGWHDDNDNRGHESQVRFDVAPHASGGTQFTLTHSGLADEESRHSHSMGWTSSLKKLEAIAN